MKKVLMFLCCLCALVVTDSMAARTCPGSHVNLQGTQNGNDDEFVFTNSRAYQEVRDCNEKGATNGYECDMKYGQLYECDKESGCTNGQYLFGNNGYVTKGGISVANKILQCSTSPDEWIQYSYTECPEKSLMNGYVKISFVNGGSRICYRRNNAGYSGGTFCCMSPERSACENDPYGIWNGQTCQCANVDGVQREWNSQKKKCEPINSSVTPTPDPITHDCGNDATWSANEGKCKCNNPTHKFNENNKTCAFDLKTCQESRQPNKEGMACCALDDAVWSGSKCICNGGRSFKLRGDGTGYCSGGRVTPPTPIPTPNPTPNPTPVPDYNCPTIDATWMITYKDCPDVVTAINQLHMDCDAKIVKDSSMFDSRLSDIKNKIKECDAQHSAAASQTITTLIGNINGELNGWKDSLTVWKNKEGKFNTARLASDSIAGVVLGTAGGLITSSVVKKSQLKSGFEDINCVIGGQKVADWHDEFRVGIQ